MNREERRKVAKKKWPFNTETARLVEKAVDAAEEITMEQRNEIVGALDVEAAKKLFPMLSPESLLPMLHKVRYEITTMTDEQRFESRRWLEQNGHNRMRNLPWPPPGELDQ